jgi:hypothetical protein
LARACCERTTKTLYAKVGERSTRYVQTLENEAGGLPEPHAAFYRLRPLSPRLKRRAARIREIGCCRTGGGRATAVRKRSSRAAIATLMRQRLPTGVYAACEREVIRRASMSNRSGSSNCAASRFAAPITA